MNEDNNMKNKQQAQVDPLQKKQKKTKNKTIKVEFR